MKIPFDTDYELPHQLSALRYAQAESPGGPMKLNIFRIEPSQLGKLRSKLSEAGLAVTGETELSGWAGEFWFSQVPDPSLVTWTGTFSQLLGGGPFFNTNYFGVFLLAKNSHVFAISFGKAHFYVRPFCDYDFGIDIAKRIADEGDVSQISAKRFQNRRRKSIDSYAAGSRLNIPAGESVDLVQAGIVASAQKRFGVSGKFGTSLFVTPDVTLEQIGEFLDHLVEALGWPERFTLPRTVRLADGDETARYDQMLIEELLSPVGASEFVSNSYDLFGVDFVFSSRGEFSIKCGHFKAADLDRLTIQEVKEYIDSKDIPRERVLDIRVTSRVDGDPVWTQPIKECLDFICEEDRVLLSGGRWVKFNQDYLDYLDDAVRSIDVEVPEAELVEISGKEGDFNLSMAAHGYSVADKDFEVFKTRSATPVEAWDLSREETVYAVKFGTPQKLGYVCDQASAVLELLRNKAEVRRVPRFARYCLWLGYRAKNLPANIADSGSIILKQKIDAWARRCDELGITPVIKMSLYTKEGVERPR